jgi:hypothetical protein
LFLAKQVAPFQPTNLGLPDAKSKDYTSQLYCGTVARRASQNVDEKDNSGPVDKPGFIHGVQEIIQIYNSNSVAFLNSDERSWIRSHIGSEWGKMIFGKGEKSDKPFWKMWWTLLTMSTIDTRQISFPVILEEVKEGKEKVKPKRFLQSIEFLKNFPKSPDALCENIRISLLQLLQSWYAIPDLNDRKEIQAALRQKLPYFLGNDPRRALELSLYFCTNGRLRPNQIRALYSSTLFCP